jgi:hypothetical protein
MPPELNCVLSLAVAIGRVNHSRKMPMALPIVLMSQPFIVTSAVFLTAAASFAGLAIKDRRPRESLDTPLIPTIPLMLLSGIVAMMALTVMVGLLR